MIYEAFPQDVVSATLKTASITVARRETVTVDDVIHLSLLTYAAELKSKVNQRYSSPNLNIRTQITRVAHG